MQTLPDGSSLLAVDYASTELPGNPPKGPLGTASPFGRQPVRASAMGRRTPRIRSQLHGHHDVAIVEVAAVVRAKQAACRPSVRPKPRHRPRGSGSVRAPPTLSPTQEVQQVLGVEADATSAGVVHRQRFSARPISVSLDRSSLPSESAN